MTRIAIAADHAGFTLKQDLARYLREQGHEILDVGTDSTATVDYPAFCAAAARAVVAGDAERAIVLGGSGQGEQIAANKVHGVRAALCHDLYTARRSADPNAATVRARGGRIVPFGRAGDILELWLPPPCEGGRHERRVAQIADI